MQPHKRFILSFRKPAVLWLSCLCMLLPVWHFADVEFHASQSIQFIDDSQLPDFQTGYL
ncbi:hypothetical protein JW948_09630 [bacterium]|nr:hypothetical protein [bacterium]